MGQENAVNFMHIENVEFVSMDITLGKVMMLVSVTDILGRKNVLVMPQNVVNEITLQTQKCLFDHIFNEKK